MINTKTYLELTNKYSDYYYKKKRSGDELDAYNKIIEYNRYLVERYPFLLPKHIWTGNVLDNYDYTFTLADEIPDGWRLAFGDQMLEELRNECIRCNYLDQYSVVQIKEKFGALCWYTGSIPQDSHLQEIAHKYERMSGQICIECGKPAEYISTGWISPFCKECAEKITAQNNQEKREWAKNYHTAYEDAPLEKYFVILKDYLKEFEDEEELD